MPQSNNIYHQEKTPSLAKRSRRRTSSSSSSKQVDARPTQSSIYHEGTPKDPLTHRNTRKRSRHSSRSRKNNRLGSKILWISLVTMALIYFVVLGLSQWTHRRKGPVSEQGASSTVTQDPENTQDINNDLNAMAALEQLITQNSQIRRSLDLSLGLVQNNQHESAAMNLLRILEDNPENVEVKLTLAEIFEGQKLFSKQNMPVSGSVVWNCKTQTSGIYFVRISNPKQESIKKITYLK